MTDAIASKPGGISAVMRWLREGRFRGYPRPVERPLPEYATRAVGFAAELAQQGVLDPLATARLLMCAIDPISGCALGAMLAPPSTERVLAQVEALPLGLTRQQAADLAQQLVGCMRAAPGQSVASSEHAIEMLAHLVRVRTFCPPAPPSVPSVPSVPAAAELPCEPPPRDKPMTIEGRIILGTARVVEPMQFARDGELGVGTKVALLAWRSSQEAAERRVAGYQRKPQVVIGWLGRSRFVDAESIERD